jgi:hypoxanthine phosphoribosyltransferase
MDAAPSDFDLVANAETVDAEHLADLVEVLAHQRGLREQGLMLPVQEAALQFEARLKLAKHGITHAGNLGSMARRPFVNDSEQIFANLLDFYRIAWEYEPKSFPIQWDRDGRPLESFTPDFYLPELDLYVEITTMKQAHVTRKNRKVKLLKTIYPHLNTQIFYQRDFHNLIFKYGLAPAARPVTV